MDVIFSRLLFVLYLQGRVFCFKYGCSVSLIGETGFLGHIACIQCIDAVYCYRCRT